MKKYHVRCISTVLQRLHFLLSHQQSSFNYRSMCLLLFQFSSMPLTAPTGPSLLHLAVGGSRRRRAPARVEFFQLRKNETNAPSLTFFLFRHCILGYRESCQWRNWYLWLFSDGFSPRIIIEQRCKMVVACSMAVWWIRQVLLFAPKVDWSRHFGHSGEDSPLPVESTWLSPSSRHTQKWGVYSALLSLESKRVFTSINPEQFCHCTFNVTQWFKKPICSHIPL